MRTRRYPKVIHANQFTLYRSDYPRGQGKLFQRHWIVVHEPSGTFVPCRRRREGLWLLKHAAKRLH